MKRTSVLLITTIIFIAIIVISTLYIFRGHKTVEHLIPDVTLQANELFSVYEKNETEANSKYLGKVIEVTGNIGDIEKKDERTIIILKDKSDFSGVRCMMDVDSELPTLPDLKIGDTVTIRGECDGFLFDVILKRCVIIN